MVIYMLIVLPGVYRVLVCVSYSLFVCLSVTVTVSAGALFLIAGGVQPVC